MTVSGEVTGEVGGRNHFIDFDLDSTEFSDNFEDGNTSGWSQSGGSWSVVTDGSKVLSQSIRSGS